MKSAQSLSLSRQTNQLSVSTNQVSSMTRAAVLCQTMEFSLLVSVLKITKLTSSSRTPGELLGERKATQKLQPSIQTFVVSSLSLHTQLSSDFRHHTFSLSNETSFHSKSNSISHSIYSIRLRDLLLVIAGVHLLDIFLILKFVIFISTIAHS